jgi:ABC-type polysaccharide/polyol phosphate export permease
VAGPTADLTLRIIVRFLLSYIVPACSREEIFDVVQLTWQSWFYISTAFGLSLWAFASVFFRVTGSIFNPSVGLALWLSGVIGTVRFVRESLINVLAPIQRHHDDASTTAGHACAPADTQ